MAKTLRTSGDYTIKTGSGSGGSNTVFLNSKFTRVLGDLVVEGTRTELNTSTLTIEDQFLTVNKNNSTADTEDAGIFFERGSENNAVFYWDAGNDEFQLGTTTNVPSDTAITNITLANLKVADPTSAEHAASKSYVDAQVGGASAVGDLSIIGSTISTPSNADLTLTPGGTGAVDMGAIRIRDNHIEGTRSNDDILIQPAGTGAVVIQDVLTFEANASTPTASAITKIYSKTAAGGGTGVFFNNSSVNSGTEDELISKKKATAIAIALG